MCIFVSTRRFKNIWLSAINCSKYWIENLTNYFYQPITDEHTKSCQLFLLRGLFKYKPNNIILKNK